MTPSLTARDKRHGMGYAFLGQSLGILLFMLFMRSAFGPLFLKQLGASDRWAMWVLSTPALMPLVQIPLSLLVHPRRAKVFLIAGWSLFGLAIAAAAVIPSTARDLPAAPAVAVGLVFLALVANLAANTFWFPLLQDVVPGDFRGRFFGRLRSTWGGLLYLAVVLSGLYLGEAPDLRRFQAIIFIGVLLVVLRNLLVSRVPVLPRAAADDDDHADVGQYLKDIWAVPGLRRFLAYFAVLTVSLGFLGQPLVLYMRDIGIHPRDNLLLFGCTTLGMVAVLVTGGNLMDRVGTLKFFSRLHVAVCAVIFLALAVTFLPNGWRFYALGAVFALSGATIALSNLACTAHLLGFVPRRGRVFYLSIASFMLFLGPAFGTFVTGLVLGEMGHLREVAILGGSLNIFQVLLLTAGVSALASTSLLRRIGAETRARSDAASAR